MQQNSSKNWLAAAAVYTDRRAVALFFLGFSAGVPILLIFSSLSLWLREAGVERSTVTMFSWAALAYSFKFVWAPLIDSLPLPFFTRALGKRRGWLLFSQVMVVAAVCSIAMINPVGNTALVYMAAGAVLLGFSSATQDVVIDAYRIETAADDIAMQSVTAATYNAGYRVGMIVAGAGALFLAARLGSHENAYVYAAWRQTYFIMAAVMGVGVAATLLVREPAASAQHTASRSTADNLRLLLLFAVSVGAFVAAFSQSGKVLPQGGGPLAAFGWEAVRLLLSAAAAASVGATVVKSGVVPKKLAADTWIQPITDFFERYGKSALLLLALIGVYRISDIVAGVISNVFYQDMGFSKEEIAAAVKTFGVVMAVAGGFLGGLLSQKFALMKMMMAGAVLAALTNLLFVVLAYRGHDVAFMYLAVGFDNLAAGLAGAVFIAFLSALTNIRFTAVQYAVFSSLMTLLPKTLGGYSGAMVDKIGYPGFFTLTALLGVPVLLLVYLAEKKLFAKNSSGE
ncbi:MULTISPECIES: MFS transporter [Neisseria]|uniref:Major Facilitator Superfamily protein n=1 Tax=Neisseria musculi TaxID=1815583 RepID=A0A7H1MFF5_9NEIS|nr:MULTISPECIES: MFS transporter [Neisseria]MBF0803857.1 MFS transporter [Neisseria sp. 19428wB4_WF04]QNT60370.1 major Facilitator Superfamily protein [Neisseria musculi]TFU43450.1 MFS transporter [Neisseria sp. WF04]